MSLFRRNTRFTHYLTSISGNYTLIAPSTALCFPALSASFLVYARDPANGIKRRIIAISTFLVFLFSIIILLGISFGIQFEKENLSMQSKLAGTYFPAGHMPPIPE
jgi:hypothetical protein